MKPLACLLLLTSCHILESGIIEQSCEDMEAGCQGNSDDSGPAADLDGDGYTGADDCNDNDDHIYPGAPEYCDGIDSDCGGDDDEGLISADYENFTTIQEAINAAAEGATINICEGNWAGNLMISKSLTLLGLNGAEKTIISAVEPASVVFITRGEVELRGLTLTGGTGSEWVYGKQTFLTGGALQIQGGSTRLMDMVLTGNSAELGGGIFLDVGLDETQIEGTIIQNNTATMSGGGIFSYSNLTAVQAQISNNTSEGAGGGLYFINTVLHLDRSTVASNSASSSAGGVGVQDGTLSCYNESTIRENSADWGGGVYLNSGAIEGCELESNEANYGGGIGIHAAEEFRLESLTVKENTAVHYGGGVYTNDVRGEMNSCLIEGNTAEYGGGMIVFGEESTIVLNEGKYLSNQASENGGGIYFDMGYLEGNSIDFGLVEQVNSPDDIGVYESNYSGLGEDRSFICQDTSGVFSCSY